MSRVMMSPAAETYHLGSKQQAVWGPQSGADGATPGPQPQPHAPPPLGAGLDSASI